MAAHMLFPKTPGIYELPRMQGNVCVSEVFEGPNDDDLVRQNILMNTDG